MPLPLLFAADSCRRYAIIFIVIAAIAFFRLFRHFRFSFSCFRHFLDC